MSGFGALLLSLVPSWIYFWCRGSCTPLSTTDRLLGLSEAEAQCVCLQQLNWPELYKTNQP